MLDACLKEIVTALLQADVNVRLVGKLRDNVKTRANNADKGAGLNKRKIIEKAVVDELSSMLSSGVDEKKLVDLKKGQPNVIMFVGLQVLALSLMHDPLRILHSCSSCGLVECLAIDQGPAPLKRQSSNSGY